MFHLYILYSLITVIINIHYRILCLFPSNRKIIYIGESPRNIFSLYRNVEIVPGR